MTFLDDAKNMHPLVKKLLGVALILLGVFALLTPLTPGSWLALIGLELLGFRILFIDKIRDWFKSKDKENRL